jgi:hypothetical protein
VVTDERPAEIRPKAKAGNLAPAFAERMALVVAEVS